MPIQVFDIPNPWSSATNPSLVQLSENRFMATWCAGSADTAKDTSIAGAYFIPGSGWSTPRTLVKTPDCADGNSVLFIDQSGTLWIFWNTIREENKSAVRPLWSCTDNKYIKSSDYGRTWSDTPIALFPEQIGWNFKNKPLYLSNGYLLVPMHDELQGRSLVAISENNSLSWSPSQFIETDQDQPGRENVIESETEEEDFSIPFFQNLQPTLFQKQDGTVVALLRMKNLDYIHKAYSADFGFTWSESEPTNLPNSASGIDVVKLENGDLIIICNNSNKHMSALTLGLSRDEGETWPFFKNLEDEPNSIFSQPAIMQDAQGQIHVTYCYNGKNIRHVILEEKWLET